MDIILDEMLKNNQYFLEAVFIIDGGFEAF